MNEPIYDEVEYLPEEWLIELGKIVKAWVTFEKLFDLMLQKLAGYDDPFDPTFTILTAHSSFPQGLDMFKSLCVRHVENRHHLGTYKEVINLIADAQRLRNFFMHNLIGPGLGENMKVSKVSARGVLKMELVDVSLTELSEAHRKILKAGREVYKLVLNTNPWTTG